MSEHKNSILSRIETNNTKKILFLDLAYCALFLTHRIWHCTKTDSNNTTKKTKQRVFSRCVHMMWSQRGVIPIETKQTDCQRRTSGWNLCEFSVSWGCHVPKKEGRRGWQKKPKIPNNPKTWGTGNISSSHGGIENMFLKTKCTIRFKNKSRYLYVSSWQTFARPLITKNFIEWTQGHPMPLIFTNN